MKTVPPLLWLVMVAVPALVHAAKMVPPLLLSMFALPALLVSVPPRRPKFVVPPLWFLMVALPAVLVSKKKVAPPNLLVMVAVLALVALKKDVSPPSLVIEVIPVVLALTMLKKPSLTTPPTMLACVASVPSCSVAQEQMKVPPV